MSHHRGETLAADLLDRAQQGAHLSDLRGHAARQMAELVGADDVQYVPYDEHFLKRAPGYLLRLLDEPRYAAEIARFFTTCRHQQGLYIDTDTFSARERDQMSFYNEVIRPARIQSFLGATVHWHYEPLASLHVVRAHKEFQPERMAWLVPPLRALAAVERASGSSSYWRATPAHGLTPREREVAQYVAAGLRNAEIASTLGVSVHTVRHQLESIFKKCDVETRVELARVELGQPASEDPRAQALRQVMVAIRQALRRN